MKKLFVIVLIMTASLAVRADEFQGLGKMGFSSVSAEGVSPDGLTVVGSGNAEAFSWTEDGGFVSLASNISYAYGASSDGSVIAGYCVIPDLDEYRACRWTSSGMEVLAQIGVSYYSAAWDISADGSVIVGEKDTEEGREAFISVDGGSLVGLGDFEGGSFSSDAWGVSGDGSVVVGRGRSGSGSEAFRWTAAAGMVGLGSLEGGSSYSFASAVSDDGSVVVGCSDSSNGVQAFRWTAGGGMVGLGNLPSGDFYSWANDVSADGSVVVGRSKTDVGNEAFIWDAANGMRHLQDLLEASGLDLTGWVLETATGVSADGCTVVGKGTNPEGSNESWMAVVGGAATNDFSITDFSTDLLGGNTRLQWNSISGNTYQVEYTDVLTNTDWNPLLPVTSTSNQTVLIHTNGLGSSTDSRFYRIILEP